MENSLFNNSNINPLKKFKYNFKSFKYNTKNIQAQP